MSTLPEGVPMAGDEAGWEMGAEVHVQDAKLVEKEQVWAKGKVVGVEGECTGPRVVAVGGSNAVRDGRGWRARR
jgi:hypothetical protein